jgi:hypothetical protein
MNGVRRLDSKQHTHPFHVHCRFSELDSKGVPCVVRNRRRVKVLLGQLGRIPTTKSAFSRIVNMVTSVYRLNQVNQRAWSPALVETRRRRE